MAAAETWLPQQQALAQGRAGQIDVPLWADRQFHMLEMQISAAKQECSRHSAESGDMQSWSGLDARLVPASHCWAFSGFSL